MEASHHTIEAAKARDEVMKILEEVPVKSACGIAVRNFLKGHVVLENPRYFISTGRIIHDPTYRIKHEMAGIAVFGKTDFSVRGCSGLLSYDISGTDLMICVLFSVPLSEIVFENKFNVGLRQQAELDENLFHELYQKCRTAEEEITTEEKDFVCKGTMTHDSKALLMLDISSSKTTPLMEEVPAAAPRHSEPVDTGHALELRLQQWIQETPLKCVCAIGINNYTKFRLVGPENFIYTGKCLVDLPENCEPNRAAPCLFSKSEFSLRGTSGVLTYTVEGGPKNHKLAIMWSIPLSETVMQNYFNVRLVPHGTICNQDLYNSMRESSRAAKDGEMKRTEADGFHLEATMDTDSKATCIVNLHFRQ